MVISTNDVILRSKLPSLLAVLLCLPMLSTRAAAAAPEVFVTGLQLPSKLLAIGGGSLLVTEAGTTPNSARISIIDNGGNRRTLIDGLPSGPAAPDFSPDGPNGLALSGRTLYIANGEGDAHINGPRTGTIVPNPAGPSSPILSTVLRMTFSEDPAMLAAGFSLSLQDHFTLADGKSVTLDNGAGGTVKIKLLSAFRPDRPDPRTIYRNTHLYGLTLLPEQPDRVYLADAGNNAVWRINQNGGTPRLVVRFPNTPNPTPNGPPTIEAVPTSIRPLGDQLVVSLLSGAPFVPGVSRVMLVNPATGNAVPLIGNLSSTIDVLSRTVSNWKTQFFVLEFSADQSAQPPLPGRLFLYNGNTAQLIADNLVTPTSMALDEASGSLFITSLAQGTVLKFPLP